MKHIVKMGMIVASLLTLSACGGGPKLDAFNDRGGVISYHAINTGMGDVLLVAERYCTGIGRKARLNGSPAMGWDSMQVGFDCVE